MKKILFILADGFEEIEAFLPIDFLRRLNFEVTLAGLLAENVSGAHGITVKIDDLIGNIDPVKFDAVILPGGMPGSTNLRDNPNVINVVKQMDKAGKLVGAICAAPIVLEKAGILYGKKHTAHPAVKDIFKNSTYTENRTETDSNIITGKGPGVSVEFALEIAKYLGKKNEAVHMFNDMFFKN